MFKEDVFKIWKSLPTVHLLPKLLSLSSSMSKWGCQFFHKFRDKVKNQKELLNTFVSREDEEGIQT